MKKTETNFHGYSKNLFKEPKIIITDSCSKIEIGIRFQLSESTHLVCAWHIYKNFFEHIHSLVSHEDWSIINKTFWILTKETDERKQYTFDTEYAALVEIIEKAAESRCDSDKKKKLMDNAVSWLRVTLYEKRHMWAYRFTWRHFTAGCHSTQRAESIHSAAKVCLFIYIYYITQIFLSLLSFLHLFYISIYMQRILNCSNFSMLELLQTIFKYQDDRSFEGLVRKEQFKSRLAPISGVLLEVVRQKKLSKYIFDKFEEQYSQKDFYSSRKLFSSDGDHIGWTVRRIPLKKTSDHNENHGDIGVEIGVDVEVNGQDEPKEREVTLSGACSCQLH